MSWGDPDPIEGGWVEAPMPMAGDRLAPGFALLMGIGSILMSYVPASHFAFIAHYYAFAFDPRAPLVGSWRSMLFGLTNPWVMTLLLGWLTIAWALGYAGWKIARAARGHGHRGSLASTAARFSALGMIGCGLDLAILAGMLAYRWTR